MNRVSQAEKFLLDGIAQGRQDAWEQLVGRFQGRLLAFASARLRNRDDAEDAVQETFIALLKSLSGFQGRSSLETYLFSILQRKIIDQYRRAGADKLCLIQDLQGSSNSDEPSSSAFNRIAAAEPTASWYVRRDERREGFYDALAGALEELLSDLKEKLSFEDLKAVELLFYCQLPNKQIAALLDRTENHVAVLKHRSLARVRDRVSSRHGEIQPGDLENLLTEIWETNRPSCPKRSTIGAYELGTLETQWQNYVDFHLHQMGCRFCRANLDDLRTQNAQADSAPAFHQKIMESTVGFLTRA